MEKKCFMMGLGEWRHAGRSGHREWGHCTGENLSEQLFSVILNLEASLLWGKRVSQKGMGGTAHWGGGWHVKHTELRTSEEEMKANRRRLMHSRPGVYGAR